MWDVAAICDDPENGSSEEHGKPRAGVGEKGLIVREPANPAAALRSLDRRATTEYNDKDSASSTSGGHEHALATRGLGKNNQVRGDMG